MLHFFCARKCRCVGVEWYKNELVWVELIGHPRKWCVSNQGRTLPQQHWPWRRAKLAMSIHDAHVIHQSLEVPEFFQEADIAAQISLTLPTLFPNGLEVASDFYREEKTHVAFYACLQRVLKERKQWAKAEKLKLDILEPESLALSRAYQQSSQAKRRGLLLHGRCEQISALLLDEDQVLMRRTIDLHVLSEQAALEALLLGLEAYVVKQVWVSGQVPMNFQQQLRTGLNCSVDKFEYGEFSVALGLAIGAMHASY